MNTPTPSNEIQAVRDRLSNSSGKAYWRTLDEAVKTPVFEEMLRREFPGIAALPADDVTRRNFLKVMGATLAFAGATSGCARQPSEDIYPYIKQPENMIPGVAQEYATAATQGGYATGLIAVSHMGRPTHLKGLPGHPSNLGGLDAQTQASILNLYDPDRSQTVLHRGQISSWESFTDALNRAIDNVGPEGAGKIRILTETVTSPTLIALMRRLNERLGAALQWHQYEPVNQDSSRAAAEMVFGKPLDPIYDFAKADIVLSLDANFLTEGPGHLRYARDFAARRDVDLSVAGTGGMNRLYSVETSPTLTGASADHNLAVSAFDVEALARDLAARLNVSGVTPPADPGAVPEQWVEALAEDLLHHTGRSIVVVGPQQPAIVHALAFAINVALGNDEADGPVAFIEPLTTPFVTSQIDSLAQLVTDMNDDNVSALLILGGNPVYTAPGSLNFKAAMEKVSFRAHLSQYLDETSYDCHWHVPEAHYLESWGDARAHDGTISLQQPLIAPLYGGVTATEVISALVNDSTKTSMELLKEYWESRKPGPMFATKWKQWLSEGLIDAADSRAARFAKVAVSGAVAWGNQEPRPSGMTLVVRPDASVWDGRYTNNAWLQELPRPLTKITWENAALIAPATAVELGLKDSNALVEVGVGGNSIELPVWITPGHPKNAVTIHLGYGRERAGKVGTGLGADAGRLRSVEQPWFISGVSVKPKGKLSKSQTLARTEDHHLIDPGAYTLQGQLMEERALIRETSVAQYLSEHSGVARATSDAHAEPAHQGASSEAETVDHGGHGGGHSKTWPHDKTHAATAEQTLYDPAEKVWEGEARYNWGMTIDLNRCTGCNACTIACQSENVIPVVGKTEVHRGREMHWIRVDRYYQGSLDAPRAFHQPVPCMQCENASCEPVCPVGATMHSREGLNDMVYNRCIGTRYCSNNCPYKVRRFNFFHYSKWPFGTKETGAYPETSKLGRNPNVTVRFRGVMEKCTYCVQRINAARIDAKKAGQPITDGAVVTACQSACPTAAINFGDISDSHSVVAAKKADPRNYSLLDDIGTRPRTTYLAKLSNYNPKLEKA